MKGDDRNAETTPSMSGALGGMNARVDGVALGTGPTSTASTLVSYNVAGTLKPGLRLERHLCLGYDELENVCHQYGVCIPNGCRAGDR